MKEFITYYLICNADTTGKVKTLFDVAHGTGLGRSDTENSYIAHSDCCNQKQYQPYDRCFLFHISSPLLQPWLL